MTVHMKNGTQIQTAAVLPTSAGITAQVRIVLLISVIFNKSNAESAPLLCAVSKK